MNKISEATFLYNFQNLFCKLLEMAPVTDEQGQKIRTCHAPRGNDYSRHGVNLPTLKKVSFVYKDFDISTELRILSKYHKLVFAGPWGNA